MRSATVARCDPKEGREYRRKWLEDPHSRELVRAAWNRHASKTKAKNKQQAALERTAREIARSIAPERTGTCVACAAEFTLNRAGRPRQYCEACVTRFKRSSRVCGGCGKVISINRRRMTCRHCGKLWGRKGDGKV